MTVWMRAAGWLLKVSAFVCIAVAITFWVADRRFLAVLAVLGGFALMILGALLGPPRKTGAFIAQDMMENDLDMLDHGFVDDVPTIGGLLAEARRARDAEADVVDVAVDPADGHPMSIDIDWDRNSIDDEACYVITDFKELT